MSNKIRQLIDWVRHPLQCWSSCWKVIFRVSQGLSWILWWRNKTCNWKLDFQANSTYGVLAVLVAGYLLWSVGFVLFVKVRRLGFTYSGLIQILAWVAYCCCRCKKYPGIEGLLFWNSLHWFLGCLTNLEVGSCTRGLTAAVAELNKVTTN